VQAAGVAAAGMRAEFGPSPLWLGIVFAASGAGLLLGAVAGGRTGGKTSSEVLIGILPIVIVAGLSVVLLGWQKSTERPAGG
jgi:hypothetical protein